jgi:glyoxylase-like metal-dependent hydrolase (beta-lactamase superfamily II)
MELPSFNAQDLFAWLTTREDFLLLDVRNDEEFDRFKIEGPYAFEMLNVPYMEFIEKEEESVAKVPKDKRIRIVCAKEGSSKYVGEILVNHGFQDVAHMQVGIKAWGNLLSPIRVNQPNDYELYQFRRPAKASCSYGLLFQKELMLFDPAKNVAAYQSFAQEHDAAIIKTIETHRQADYISGSPMLQRGVGAEIIAPEADFKVARFAFTPARDGEILRFSEAGPEVKVIHTPGHTPGSTSYLIDGKYLITGDTIFILSIGRPDLGGEAEEWSKLLFRTMRDIILPMDESVTVLPGHYIDWKEANADLIFAASLGTIKEKNTDIYSIRDESAFYEFIKANIRKQPEEYAKIREINAGLVEVDEEQQDIMDLGKNECAASSNPPPKH